MRGVLIRSIAVLGIGLAILGGILFYATTVDGRPPEVLRIGLTQHPGGEPTAALTTTSIEVEFSEPVDAESAQAAFGIEPQLEGSFSWAGNTLIFSPEERLPLDTEFTVRVAAGVRDGVGNAMQESSEPFAFTTVGQPQVVRSSPEDGATDVTLEAVIELEFSTLMDTASVEEGLRISPSVAFDLRWEGEVLTISPRVPLRQATEYRVEIGRTVLDQAGVALAGTHRFSFRTVRSQLEALTVIPADGTEGIAVSAPLAVITDRELDPGSVSAELLSIEPEVAGDLEAVEQPGAAGLRTPGIRLLRFVPSGPLEPNTTYRVSVALGLRAADGSGLAEPLSWSFTTGAPLDTLGNQIAFVTDRGGIANLWAMHPDGTGQRQISAELSPVLDYAVAPDGRSLVVADGARLVEMRPDGRDRRVLTDDEVVEYDPAYAPDSSTLAFGRASAETGEGLGLWTRRPLGGDVAQLEFPDELTADPSPSPSPEGGAARLRAPRFSPDGAALAFVDEAGRLGVLELPAERLTTAPFGAVGPPAWLPDSSGLLVPGLQDAPPPPPVEEPPLVVPLDPATLDIVDPMEVRLMRLDRAASRVSVAPYPPGVARVAVAPGGRRGYVVSASGRLWITAASGNAPVAVLNDDGPKVVGVAPGPGNDAFLAVRGGSGSPRNGPAAGIWRVTAESGRGESLVEDGWLPRWLP